VDPALALIVEEITRRFQRGEEVDLDEYARGHPEWAVVLGSLLSPLRVLADFGLTAISAPSSGPPPSPVVLPMALGDFIVRREVGRGGMGIVYEAEQVSLGRRVALKILSTAGALDSQASRRFQVEAQAAAGLDHAHIIPVYAIGSHDDVAFYAMQFIEGASLAEIVVAFRRLRDGGIAPGSAETVSLPVALALDLMPDRFGPGGTETRKGPTPDIRNSDYVRAVVRLAAQAAEALDHAHERGVLHRDVKPANLLLDRFGKLWVADFGLARIMGSETMTVQGSLAGTLRYMSPEQVLGKRALVDRRSDLYSLGATLYELLTLELAIQGHERWEKLSRIDDEEPRPIRRLNPAVPRDLAVIVAKAMAKDVSGRYETALEFGEDLRRFLEGRPVKARRAGAWEQVVRWGRRNPAVASLLTALVVVFFTGFAAVTVLWRRAESEANRANRTAEAQAEARAAQANLRIQAQAQAAARDLEHAMDLARRGDADQGLLWMAEALRQVPPERPELVRMARANLAAWTDRGPSLKAILEHHAAVPQAVFRPDGRAVLTGSMDGTAQVWDATSGRPIGPPLKHGNHTFTVAFSPDGRLILTGGSDGKARIWQAATGRPAGPTLVHSGDIRSVRFSPDGRLVSTLSTDRTMRVWNIAVRPAWSLAVHDDVVAADFSPDGRSLLTVGVDGAARLWEAATGRPIRAIRHPDDRIIGASLSPDHRLIATTGKAGATRLWEAASGRPVGAIMRHDTAYMLLIFSPDSKLLLTTGAGRTARLWDTATGRGIGPVMRHAGEVYAASFSPDGQLILTGSRDHTARLWDAASGRPVGSPLRHGLFVKSVAFSPDGTLILTAADDGTARLWGPGDGDLAANAPGIDGDPDEGDGGPPSPNPGVPFETAAFSPDRGRVLLASRTDGVARMVETDIGQPIGPPMAHRWSWVRAAAFSPDGRRIATSSHSRGPEEANSTSSTCQIWDAVTARPCSPLLPHANYVAALAFRPDGKVLATGDYSGLVHIWDTETGTRPGPPLAAGSIVVSLAFSPNGQLLAAGTAEPRHRAVLWDLEAGLPRGEPLRFKRQVIGLAFSRDGRRLAIASDDTTVRLVDVATGRVAGEPMPHAESVRALAFSPDGGVLLTVNSGLDGTGAARLWDVATCRPICAELARPSVATGALAFSSDGTAFATGYEDGTVCVWDVASAAPIGPPRVLRDRVLAVAFGADGRTLLAVDRRGDVRSWPAPIPPDEPDEQLIRRTKARTGLELDATGTLVVLDPESWHRHRAEPGDPPRIFGTADDRARHEARARDAEAVGDGFAARWHLERLISEQPDDALLRARLARALILAGDRGSAAAEIARAFERGPRNRVRDWLVQRAEDFRASGRPEDALLLLDRVIAAGPDDDWAVHARRAEVLDALGRTAERQAELDAAVARGADIPFLIRLAAARGAAGSWKSAADLYDRAIALGTVPHEVWVQSAVAHLELDDLAGYRRVCRSLQTRQPGAVPEALVRLTLASACTLGPGGLDDEGKVRTWADGFLASLPSDRTELKHTALSLLGGLLFRSGRPREAIDRINDGIALADGEISLEDAAYLAMAYDESGNRAMADQMLARASPNSATGSASIYWYQEAIDLLCREAQRHILDRRFPADPFAP
jgi:WD40 repeat protein/serine/threonine protein kinase/tetratricopeptide (TPR) repeat protein